MPIYRSQEVTDGNAFTGATALLGLFQLTQSGARYIQIRINSLKFHTSGAAVAFSLKALDPVNTSNTPEIIGATDTDLAIEGPTGAMILPTENDGTPWGLKFTTGNMSGGSGWLVIDYDFEGTEG
jgi:hypothetical protein